MAFDGHIENGVAVFDEPVSLPDGLKVRIVPIADMPRKPEDRKTLAERFRDVIGAVDDLPADMAEKHDEYLHGMRICDRMYGILSRRPFTAVFAAGG
jgi:hypothetical protein